MMSASALAAREKNAFRKRLMDAALDVSQAWIVAMPRTDKRRQDVLKLTAFVCVRLALDDTSPETFRSLHSMFCTCCRGLHPSLASICSGKPLDQCWLLKGYRCEVAMVTESRPAA
jgi:hypothetical protein